MALNGSTQLNNLYRASSTFNANAYNPGDLPYDTQTQQAILDYSSNRTTIFAASSTAGDVRPQILELVRLTDQAVNAKDNADQAVKFYQPSTSATSSTNMQKANTVIDGAAQLATSSVAQARALLDGITDALYLNVKAPGIDKLTTTKESVAQAHSDYLTILSAASNKQLQAELIASSVVNYLAGAYVLLNGDLDPMLNAMGVNLATVHKAYVVALRAAKKDVPGDKMITLVESGALEHLCNLAETVASRCIQVARQDLKANFAKADNAASNQ